MANTESSHDCKGPLGGMRVVFMGGIGPAPYGAMLLADLGADVIRIDRPVPASDAAMTTNPDDPFPLPVDPLSRGQRSLALDLKREEDIAVAWHLIERADVLIEGFRPGVLERLGFAPQTCQARNPRLVLARVTGWGQSGPLAQAPGHDINYIALTGVLDVVGRPGGPPAIPLNLVGDFAGGGLWMAFGVMAALFERQGSGRGQIVDAAMIDGALSLMNMAYVLQNCGQMAHPRGENLLDGGSHLYDTYECADGGRVAVGAIEPAFYRTLCEKTGLADPRPQHRLDPKAWPSLKRQLAAIFITRTRDEWCRELEGTAACVSPVLSIAEAPHHPHHIERRSFASVDGVMMPAAGPRFSRTPPGQARGFARAGANSDELRAELSIQRTTD